MVPPDVAAPGNEAQGDEDEEDGGEASAEAGPVEVNKGEPVVGLIQVDVHRLMVDLVGNGEIGIVVEVERRGLCSECGCPLPLNESFVLFPDLVVH